MKTKIITIFFFFIALSSYADIYEYTVKKGDTLLELCSAFKVTIQELKENNPNSKIEQLRMGEKLRIPLKNHRIIEYQLKKGDSIYDLHQKYSLNLELLYMINEEDSLKKMWAGTKIKLPIWVEKNHSIKHTQAQNTKQEKKEEKKNQTSNIIHTVQKGETLYSIAKRYNISVQEIMNQNKGLDKLLIGQKIIIPSSKIEEKIENQTKNSKPSQNIVSLPYYIYEPKKQGQIIAPLDGIITGIREIKGYGKAFFIEKENLTLILASKGYQQINAGYGEKIKKGDLLANAKEGYPVYFFVLKDGEFISPSHLFQNL